ncbi:MAG TPA: DoxX family protein [Alphaproteobacteria bacterium]|nr:DoxX family protein [Alphaproteobacteria bacterium]
MKGEGLIGKKIMQYEDYFYVVFRVLVGLFFFIHGSMKALGWFGGTQMTGLMMAVGIGELLAGVLILLGFWTRLGALIGAVIMLAAYFKAHAPGGLNPVANGGELALLFFLSFLVILVHGSGKFGLEHWFHKKERI